MKLLMHIKAPMQSYSLEQPYRLEEKLTEGFPTKSAIIGLICAAMGKDRKDDSGIKLLADLKMTSYAYVPEGSTPIIDYDYQVIGSGYKRGEECFMNQTLPKSIGASQAPDRVYQTYKMTGSNPMIRRKYFLSNVGFLVVLELKNPEKQDVELFNTIASALEGPIYPLYLGRKAFLPSCKILVGICEGDDALKDLINKTIQEYNQQENHNNLELYAVEKEVNNLFEEEHASVKYDNPISFNQTAKKNGARFVKTTKTFA